MQPIADGQFDDAEDGQDPIANIRAAHAYIDISDSENSLDLEDSDLDDLDFSDGEIRVEDEDWEKAEKDFTKQYNRLRQHVAVRSGNAQGSKSSINHSTSVAALPAVNNPKSKAALPDRGAQSDRTSDQLAALAKFSSRLSKIDSPHTMGVGVNRKGPSAYANAKDKSDRATNEQVLDPRTRLILFKMIGRGLIHEVNGCVSTGKEANVYHALTPDSKHLALKIYKTSILVFKDRDKYVTGEHRFRKGYSRRNPRKMVRLWAEKETRNLKRLLSAGIRCPEPVEVRENVLVMGFLGDTQGWASPRLKDVELPSDRCADLYAELILAVRKMYHQCKLVHADLSEYNILYHEEHLWIIDVSQSVEHDHPSAYDFLRKDLKNVEEFFGRLGVKCLGLRRSFDFITRENFPEGLNDEEVLKLWIEEAANDFVPDNPLDGGRADASAAHEDSVFLQSYIPRNLNEVYDPERDVEVIKRGDANKLIYSETIGVIGPQEKRSPTAPTSDDGNNGAAFPSDTETESNSGDSEGGFQPRKLRGHRHEDREAKKERKKAVKAEAKEKRQKKMPKADKKRLIQKTRS